MITFRYFLSFFVLTLSLSLFFPHLALGQDPQDPQQLYRQARDRLQNEEFSTARDSFQKFTENYPNHPRYWDAYFGYGQSLYRLNELRKANRVFASVRKNHPSQAVRGDALFGQIQIAILEDKVALAKTLSQSFLKIHSEHILKKSVKRQLGVLKDMDVSESETDTTSTMEDGDEPSDTEQPETSHTSSAKRPPSYSGRKSETGANETTRQRPEVPEAGPPLRFEDGLLIPDLSQVRAEVSNAQNDGPPRGGSSEDSGGSFNQSIEDQSQYQSLMVEKNKLSSELEDLRKQMNQLRETNQNQEETIQQLKSQLEKKITNLSEDTALHEVSREMNFSDTAQQTLSGSLQELREQADQRMEEGQYSRARALNQKILRRSPQPRDYVRAAKIAENLGESEDTVNQAYRQGLQQSEEPPISEVINYAQWLLDVERFSELDRVLNEYQSDVKERGQDEQQARWALLRGQFQVRRGQEDAAFFQFMEAIRLAPNSDTARRARSIVRDEF